MAPSGHAPEAGEPRAGVFASLRQAIGTLVALAHTRLDLFSTEVEEQAERVVWIVLWGVAAVCLVSVALLVCGLALVVAYWDTHRVLVAGGLALASVVAATVAVYGFLARAKARPHLFRATLDELAKDHERLTRP
jgi:uncharacterized membrane protein YqjE